MDKCDRCGSERILDGYSKACDGNFFEYKGKSYHGYAPGVDNISDGDGIGIKVCLDCGKVQGKFPVEDPDTSYWDKDEPWIESPAIAPLDDDEALEELQELASLVDGELPETSPEVAREAACRTSSVPVDFMAKKIVKRGKRPT